MEPHILCNIKAVYFAYTLKNCTLVDFFSLPDEYQVCPNVDFVLCTHRSLRPRDARCVKAPTILLKSVTHRPLDV